LSFTVRLGVSVWPSRSSHRRCVCGVRRPALPRQCGLDRGCAELRL